jgi:histidyl-tRNA synthetase
MLIQAPRGTKDILPDDQKYYKFIEKTIDAQAEINGFERIETPLFEYESIFTKGLGDTSDIVEKECTKLEDCLREKIRQLAERIKKKRD